MTNNFVTRNSTILQGIKTIRERASIPPEMTTFTLQGPQDRLVANLKADEKSLAEQQGSTAGTDGSTGRTPLTNCEIRKINENLSETVSIAFHGSSLTINELIANINSSAKEKIGKGFGR